jgi:Uncharacterized protein conserved in bacteria
MIIPHLHFCGNCRRAIAKYEAAFNTRAEDVISSGEYARDASHKALNSYDDDGIAHAVMHIHGQKIYLNDRFGNKNKTLDCAVHLIVTFATADELLACFAVFAENATVIDPFETLPYSELAGNFIDEFGVQWGFMVE